MKISFTNQKPLGKGQFGVVYQASDELDRNLAVKFFGDQSIVSTDIARRHATALAQIDHPNVVRILGIHDLAPPEGGELQPALVMNYLDGLDLSDWLSQGDLEVTKIISISRDILNGLKAFHARDLCHGDLHEGNIRVCDDKALLIDPMAHDPATVYSTALSKDRRRRDISNARQIITKAFLRCNIATEHIGELNAVYSTQYTVEDLGIALDSIEEGIQSTSSTILAFDSGIYQSCQRHQSDGAYPFWLNRLKSSYKPLNAQLQQWRQDHPIHIDIEWNTIHEYYYEAMNRIQAFVLVLLSAAEYDHTLYHRQASQIRQILTLDWDYNGKTIHVTLPDTICFLLHHILGSAACINQNWEFAIQLAYTHISKYQTGNVIPLWKSPKHVAWPDGLGQSCTQNYRVVKQAYDRLPYLSNCFATKNDYMVGLSAWNFILCNCECANTILPSHIDKNDPVATHLNKQKSVPPMLLSIEESIRGYGLSLVTSNPNYLNKICSTNIKSTKEFVRDWEQWSTDLLHLWSSIADWPSLRGDELSSVTWIA